MGKITPSSKEYMEFEDMIYYIKHVIDNPDSYADDTAMRAADLLQVLTHDILTIQMDRKGDRSENPLKTAGYKTLAAIDPGQLKFDM